MTRKQERTNQNYDELYFDKFHFDFNVKYPFFHKIAAALIEQKSPASVLDVGCGKGHLVYAFNQLGIDSYGVDISSYAIDQSPESIRARLFKVDVVSEVLPFQDDTFDLVTALGLIEHLEEPAHIIGEVRRVLRSSGTLFVRTPKVNTETVFRLLGISDSTHINVNHKAYWIKVFRPHGFEYAGELSRTKHREAIWAHYSQQRTNSDILDNEDPTTGLGKALVKSGKVGKLVRREIAGLLTLLPLETMFFRCTRQ